MYSSCADAWTRACCKAGERRDDRPKNIPFTPHTCMPFFVLILFLFQCHLHFHIVFDKEGIHVPGVLYFQSGTCSSSKVDRGLVQVSDQLPPLREVELLVDINPGKWLPYLILKL